MGYQLYSIRDEMEKDPVATLKALKDMGYEDFETYGYDAEKRTFYGFKANEFKTILDDLDLSVSSGHYGFSELATQPDDKLNEFVDQCIEGAEAIGSRYITWPWINEVQRTLDGYKSIAKQMNLIGERIAQAGLGFAYHNHGYEFQEFDGKSGFDIIINETDPALVKIQLDLYWVMHSSKNTPAELIAKYPGRYVMWHIKDMDKVTRDYTELGNGSIDYHKILPDPKVSGLEYYYIEQGGNFTESSMKSAASSAAYFKSDLKQYL
ncbi:TIM barrel protein [Aureisphaera galaxeae]|uniref:sugar phosphate isomerase/epimerase family protein n=1 Tax=Aureisphaera galaxeae TaxID=1538023 RepID=UPI0023503655|nr:TIM barrel protein [Aureisphaera galaxeae]MDC8003931.1 TIM barrel protein [Aureisphaera galaxeae]